MATPAEDTSLSRLQMGHVSCPFGLGGMAFSLLLGAKALIIGFWRAKRMKCQSLETVA